MRGEPNYNNMNGQQMPNVPNPSSPETVMMFNPYQFQPPSITNFSITFRNPGTYNCFIDMNPCPQPVTDDSEALYHVPVPSNQRTHTGVRYFSPSPRPWIESESESSSSSESEGAAFHPRRFVGGVLQRPVWSIYEPSPVTNGNVVRFGGTQSASGPSLTTSSVLLRPTLPTSPPSPQFQSTSLPTLNQNQENRDICGLRHMSP